MGQELHRPVVLCDSVADSNAVAGAVVVDADDGAFGIVADGGGAIAIVVDGDDAFAIVVGGDDAAAGLHQSWGDLGRNLHYFRHHHLHDHVSGSDGSYDCYADDAADGLYDGLPRAVVALDAVAIGTAETVVVVGADMLVDGLSVQH